MPAQNRPRGFRTNDEFNSQTFSPTATTAPTHQPIPSSSELADFVLHNPLQKTFAMIRPRMVSRFGRGSGKFWSHVLAVITFWILISLTAVVILAPEWDDVLSQVRTWTSPKGLGYFIFSGMLLMAIDESGLLLPWTDMVFMRTRKSLHLCLLLDAVIWISTTPSPILLLEPPTNVDIKVIEEIKAIIVLLYFFGGLFLDTHNSSLADPRLTS